jgi:H+/Cl- antiporter ClcA
MSNVQEFSSMSNFNEFQRAAKAAIRVALQWFFLAIPTGLICGLVGTLFHLSVERVTELRADQPWLLFLLPAAGLLITALYKATKCEGVGTNNVIRAVQSGEPVSILLVPAIFLGTVLTHLCGGSAGREGAALQMGGSIGWNVGTLLHLKDHDRRTATISGMAAFFSALFGTPLTAALFAMMVEDVGLTFTSAFVPAFTSALIAYGCSLAFGIAPTHFAITAPELTVWSAFLVILLGFACAAVSRLFCGLLHFMEHKVPQLLPNPWLRVFVGGVAVIAFSYLFGVGRYNGAGMGVITAAVEQGEALPWDFLCKIFLTALTLSCGFKGGEVVPSFFVGATFGCVFGPLLGLPAGFAAAVGLVSIFCGATNALIPSILMGFELFSGAGLELIALGCGICYMLSGHHGLYSSQTFVTNKLRSEYMSHKLRHKVKNQEE